MLVVSCQAGVGWIDQLYVQPGWERRGVGSRLLAAALQSLPRPVRLYAFEQNHGARGFYERWGFVAIRFGDGTGNEERVPDVLYENSSDQELLEWTYESQRMRPGSALARFLPGSVGTQGNGERG